MDPSCQVKTSKILFFPPQFFEEAPFSGSKYFFRHFCVEIFKDSSFSRQNFEDPLFSPQFFKDAPFSGSKYYFLQVVLLNDERPLTNMLCLDISHAALQYSIDQYSGGQTPTHFVRNLGIRLPWDTINNVTQTVSLCTNKQQSVFS